MTRAAITLAALLAAAAPARADLHAVPLAQTAPLTVHPAAVPPPAHVATARVGVPLVLPPPPPVTNAATGTLSTALLAIAQAQAVDPAAAQTASFQYLAAIEEYRAGNPVAARISALAALSTASQAQVRRVAPAPLPTPAIASAPAQLPGTEGGLYGADAPAIDAGAFIALARGIISDCAARHDRRLATAQAAYARAERDIATLDYEATRRDARAAIDACAQPPSAGR